jgi:Na+-transporting NADH:ubiquinone oxidoreductase subunit NqrD
MLHSELKITSKQLFAFIISAQIGIGILTLPSTLAKAAERDSWISMLIGGTISVTVTYFIVKLMERYKNKSIFEINNILYGVYLGFIFNFMILAYFFYGSFVGIRLFTDFMKIGVLKLTPPTILTTISLVPTIYLTWY